MADMTIAVPFNDAEAMERRIERLIADDRKPACVIMEAAMMNLGVVLPEPGYLEAVREITQKHSILLIFEARLALSTVHAEMDFTWRLSTRVAPPELVEQHKPHFVHFRSHK